MLHPAQLVQPRPGPGYVYKTGRAARVPQTGDDLASYYATEGLRKKQRERDGCGARSKRPSSADAIGVSGSKEFRKLEIGKGKINLQKRDLEALMLKTEYVYEEGDC